MRFLPNIITFTLLGAINANASLYSISEEVDQSLPVKWSVGLDLVWDDNSVPTAADSNDTISMNAYVGMTFARVTPQTTWDVYARLGMIYYFEEPAAGNADSTFGQARLGFNLTHRFSERLRFVSSNSLAFELEPDYSTGFATNRQVGEFLYWSTDNAIGFRWTERFATYTGFNLSGLIYDDLTSNDRLTWTVYNQFRYQLSPQTVLTSTYRFSPTTADGFASDSTNQYFLLGIEHRFNPTSIAVLNAGAQFRDVDDGASTTSPYLEFNIQTSVNQDLSLNAFARYGMEVYDTVQFDGVLPIEFDSRLTLRVGAAASYQISPRVSFSGGVDFINTTFEEGRSVPLGIPQGDQNETLANINIGASIKFTDYLFGNISYNHTISDSDFALRDYSRNRVSIGLRADF